MRVLLIGLLLIVASAVGSAHAQIVDEFSPTLCSDDLRARIDNFFVLITNSPGSKGSVNVRSGYDLPGRAMKVQRIISNHITFRGQDPERFRISIRHGGIPSVLFSLIPKGVEVGGIGTPTPSTVTYLPETLFDSSGILRVNSREVQFGEESVEPCDFGLDLAQFAEAVMSEDDSVVHLLAASSRKISRAQAITALKLTAEELSKKHGLAPSRIKTVYVGAKKEAEMQLWIVSKTAPAPKFREGALP